MSGLLLGALVVLLAGGLFVAGVVVAQGRIDRRWAAQRRALAERTAPRLLERSGDFDDHGRPW